MNIHTFHRIINPRDSIRQCALTVAVTATLAITPAAPAAINVGPSGSSGINSFAATPAVTEWSTTNWAGLPTNVTTATDPVTGLDAAVSNVLASSLTTALGSSGTINNPGPSANAIARRNSAWNLLAMRPSGSVKGCLLMATLQNTSGSDITKLQISYDCSRFDNNTTTAGEEVPGLRAYYSLTGLTGSWTPITDLCVSPTGGSTNSQAPPTTALSTVVTLSSNWAYNTKMYVLWADDDNSANGAADDANMIDNVNFTINDYVPAADMLTFNWGSYPGVIDQGAKTIMVHVPADISLNLLDPNPTFTTSIGATCNRTNGGTGEYDFSASLATPLNYIVTSSGSALSNTYKVTVLADVPNVTLEIDSSTLVEDAGVATVTATLSAATSQDVTVNLAFAGTATNATDYTRSATSIVIPTGSTSGFITLTGVPDSVYEQPDETIIVDISTVVNGIEATAQQVTATILDTPAADFLTFTWGSYNGVIDKTAQTVKLYLPHTATVNPLDPNPSFTLTNGATCLMTNGGTPGVYDFRSPVTYTITPSAGTPKDYTVTVYPVLAIAGEILPVPADLAPGDKYRLVFVTSTTTYSGGSNHGGNPPWFTTVADYHAFGAARAAAAPSLAALPTTWNAVVSTGNPNSAAKTNTATDPAVNAATSVPIYNLRGLRVADGYTDLWDGTIQNPINWTELGGSPSASTFDGKLRVWTGAGADGSTPGATSALITQDGGFISCGLASATNSGWINGNYDNAIHTLPQPIYVMSGILSVPLPGTDLITFIWGSHVGVIDQGTKTVSLTVPYGTDLTTINPTCTFSSGASVLPASGANAGFSNSHKTVTYTVTSGASHTDYAATVTVLPASAACDMLTFKSGNYSGGIGGTNITLVVPLGTDLTTLAPTYTVSPGATPDVSYPSGSTRDFTTPQSYTITAENGTDTKTYTVTVLNVPITVPRGLAPGDQYRLVFVTSTTTHSGGADQAGLTPPGFTTIAQYNDFATAAATAAPELSALSATTWKAIVSSSNPATDARDNTATSPSSTSVPIYNLGGVRVADGNSDLWDGSIQNPVTWTELGGLPPVSPFDGKLRVWTGTNMNGTSAGGQGLIWQDGGYISNGLASSVDGAWVWGNYANEIHSNLQPIYAISGILEVPAGGSAACNLVSFNYGAALGVITPGAPNTVLLTVPYGAPSLAAFTPAVTVSAFATFTPTGAQDFTNSETTPVEYTVTAENGSASQTYQVTVVRAAASVACDMVSFTAAGGAGVITPGTPNTVLVTLPPGTPVSALTPTVVVSPLAGYVPTGPQDFSGSVATPVDYTVTAEDGVTQKVYAVTVAVASRPPNDDFVNAIALPGTGGIQTGTGNRYATLETGEPGINGATHTVWFKWTAPSNGTFTIKTVGSTRVGGGEWDAMLGIYTGTAVNALTALTGLPDGNPQDTGVEETMTVPVTGGTTYHIQAAGYEDQDASNIKLTCTWVGTGTSYGSWETANGASGGATADSNNNGIPNGIEFFMGGTAASPATLPPLVDNAGTWTWTIPYDPAALVTSYAFQVSDDLAGWTDVLTGIEVLTGPNRLRLTLPSGMRFCRLVVITP
ncbi:MAG: hypothetical protein NTW21_40895 [Verrucomicrobia bacterium]|nr:hypothetical protein [Verrucomicrobiota bacterium]